MWFNTYKFAMDAETVHWTVSFWPGKFLHLCIQGVFFISSLSTSAVTEMNLESGSPSMFHVRCFIEQSSADLHMLSMLFIVWKYFWPHYGAVVLKY